MKKIFTSVFTLTIISLFIGCSDSNSSNTGNCNKQAQVISSTAFGQVSTTNYTITNVALNEDCLDVTVSSSGCDSNNWNMNLFSTGEFTSTTIPQKEIKVELVNEEACLAVFQKTVSFNLIPYQLEGQNEITLKIAGWATPISYAY
ncbi:MAG: hypothetical protein QM710_07110 [Flavobacterium sp.]